MKIPIYKKNIYSKESLLASNTVHKELRGLGEVVFLSKHKMYAITSYDAVKKVLGDPVMFPSGKGITPNSLLNNLAQKGFGVITSDGETHMKRKGILMRPLTRRKMTELKETIKANSEELVQNLKQKTEFDVAKDFAAHLPVSVVANLVGISKEGQDQMLDWAAAAFNTIGPLNWRTIKSLPSLLIGATKYLNKLSEKDVHPGGWADGVFKAVEANKLTLDEGKAMIFDYIVPSLDTTIYSAAYLFQALAKEPDTYQSIKSNPELIPGVINEVLRLSSPIRGFARHTSQEFTLNGYALPKDSRVLALYASANRDGAKYSNPEKFDIHRNPVDHMAWGHGVHKCAGMHLARLELEELLKALCKFVDKLEIGKATYIINNALQGIESAKGKVY